MKRRIFTRSMQFVVFQCFSLNFPSINEKANHRFIVDSRCLPFDLSDRPIREEDGDDDDPRKTPERGCARIHTQ